MYMQGDDKELGVRLFQVQQSGAQNWQAIEVELVINAYYGQNNNFYDHFLKNVIPLFCF